MKLFQRFFELIDVEVLISIKYFELTEFVQNFANTLKRFTFLSTARLRTEYFIEELLRYYGILVGKGYQTFVSKYSKNLSNWVTLRLFSL